MVQLRKKNLILIYFIFRNQNLHIIKASHSIQKFPLDRVEVNHTKLPLSRVEVSPLLDNNKIWKIPKYLNYNIKFSKHLYVSTGSKCTNPIFFQFFLCKFLNLKHSPKTFHLAEPQ